MAAGIPLEKAKKYIDELNALLIDHEEINVFREKAIRAELTSVNTTATNLALSYLDAVSGNLESSLDFLRLSLQVDDAPLARHYHHVLFQSFCYKELSDVAYKLGRKYPVKSFSNIAASWAYRLGDRQELLYFLDEHIKLLSEAEGRSNAMKHKDELLSEMDGIFEASRCTKEQFRTLASIIWSLLEEYKAHTGYIQLSDRGTGCYIVDVKNHDSKMIAKMNFDLADRICAEDSLDDCALLARFSSPRKLHVGVSYNASDE